MDINSSNVRQALPIFFVISISPSLSIIFPSPISSNIFANSSADHALNSHVTVKANFLTWFQTVDHFIDALTSSALVQYVAKKSLRP